MSVEQLESLQHEMKKCVRCSLCKLIPMPTIVDAEFTSACPPVDEYHFHAYSGGGLQVMALSLIEGRIKADRDLAGIAAACTTCGMCDVACKFIMAAERMEVIMALKEHLVESGELQKQHRILADNLQQFGYCEGKPVFEPGSWAQGMGIKKMPEEQAEVLLFVGAGVHQDARHATSARNLAQLLKVAGVDFGILAKGEPDCGIDLYWTGQRKHFIEQAGLVINVLEKTNAKTVVALCGEDLGMLRGIYPSYGYQLGVEVLHASEYLLELIQRGKLRLSHEIPRVATYHDPCYLGRRSEPPQTWQGEERLTHGVMTYFVPPKPINYGVNGVFEAPRLILKQIPGLQLREMQRKREYAYCCGGGGGVPDAHPDVARAAAQQRQAEANKTGAEILITACQHCRHNLTRWENKDALPLVELVDVVHQAAGLSSYQAELDSGLTV